MSLLILVNRQPELIPEERIMSFSITLDIRSLVYRASFKVLLLSTSA